MIHNNTTHCLCKYHDFVINLESGTFKSCCRGREYALGTSVDSFVNTDEFIVERKMMEESCILECSQCFKLEQAMGMSDRIRKSTRFLKIDNGVAPSESIPYLIELMFSSACNLECVYCSPRFSSRWASDINTHGKYNTINHEPYSPNNSGKIELWWSWLDKHKNLIKELRVSGGEPLLSNLREIVLVSSLLENASLSINTNLIINNPTLLKIITLLDNQKVSFNISGEASGDLFNFIRRNGSYQTWVENIKTVLSQSSINVVINSALNALALENYTTMVQEVQNLATHYNRNVTFCVHQVSNPPMLSFDAIPTLLTQKYIGDIQKLVDRNKSSFNNSSITFLSNAITSLRHSNFNPSMHVMLSKFLFEYCSRRSIEIPKFEIFKV